MTKLAFQRVLLKLSGEAFLGAETVGIDLNILREYASAMLDVSKLGVELAVVLGGGNLFRGVSLVDGGLDRVTGDQMGMLATVMNALALHDAIQQLGGRAQVMSSIPMRGIVNEFDRQQAKAWLEAGTIVIFAGGTGNPLVTTDTAASLRGVEIGADLVLKATKVDGVYAEDPEKNPQAQRFMTLSFDDVIQKNLKVMDLAAICICRENNLPIRVFNMMKKGVLKAIVEGAPEGTLVSRSVL